ncbi:helix-turn-helix domain-containing protein [uncultured Vagococcus sp.]|uniref:helix-turn-helix domain-containing protein n=1 Tax=uncultured Vagococcus sp. TaxID=189676 RepID=UPI0028D77F86|nr:helix-turn-helix domain-containing protein [uncultured Vagococcus sp.]
MKHDQGLDQLLRRHPVHLEVAQLIKELRQAKGMTQTDLSQKALISRQFLSEIENGRRRQVNLVKVADLINACGESLYVSSSYENPLQISDQTEKEDEILRAFSAGQMELAESLLAEIRNWRYPSEHIMAKCKRNMAIAISYHFRGNSKIAHGKMNNIIMGLSYLECGEEANYLTEIFYRIIKNGNKQLLKQYVNAQKGVTS